MWSYYIKGSKKNIALFEILGILCLSVLRTKLVPREDGTMPFRVAAAVYMLRPQRAEGIGLRTRHASKTSKHLKN